MDEPEPRFNYHLITFEYKPDRNGNKLPAQFDALLAISELIHLECNLTIYTDVETLEDVKLNKLSIEQQISVTYSKKLFLQACVGVVNIKGFRLQICRGSFETFETQFNKANKSGNTNIVQFSGHHTTKDGYSWPVYMQEGGSIPKIPCNKLMKIVNNSPKLIFINDCCYGPKYGTIHKITRYSGDISYIRSLSEVSEDSIKVNNNIECVYINLIEEDRLLSNDFSIVLYKLYHTMVDINKSTDMLSIKNLVKLFKHLTSRSHSDINPIIYLSNKVFSKLTI